MNESETALLFNLSNDNGIGKVWLDIATSSWRIWGVVYLINKSFYNLLKPFKEKFQKKYLCQKKPESVFEGLPKNWLSLPISYEEYGQQVTTIYWEKKAKFLNHHFCVQFYVEKQKSPSLSSKTRMMSNRSHPYRKKFNLKNFVCLEAPFVTDEEKRIKELNSKKEQ